MKKILIFTITLSLLSFSLPSKTIVYSKPSSINIDTVLNEKNLTEYLIQKKVKFLKLTLAQAKHETGNFTSVLCKTNNNLFGMRKAEIRETTALGTKGKYAFYENWQKSADDFILFQNFVMSKVKTEKAYFKYISNTYASDKKYFKKLKKYL